MLTRTYATSTDSEGVFLYLSTGRDGRRMLFGSCDLNLFMTSLIPSFTRVYTVEPSARKTKMASDIDLVIGAGDLRRGLVIHTSQHHFLPLDILPTSLGAYRTEYDVHLLQAASLCLRNDQGEGPHRTDVDGREHDEKLPAESGDPRGSVVRKDEICGGRMSGSRR